MITAFISIAILASAFGAPTTPAPTDWNTVIQGMFQRGDSNHDGIYSKAEALAIALFEDRDGDNQVSAAEYVQSFVAINPKFAAIGRGIFNRFDVDKNGFINKVDIDSGYAAVDADGNGEINNLEFTAYMSIILNALQSGFQPTTPPYVLPSVPMSLVDVSFPNDDTNKDGYLSFDEEWASVQSLDSDGDGKISKIQFVQVFSNTSDSLGELWPALFDVVDFDRNGFIEKGDVVKIFQLYDADGNGLASIDEVKAGFGKINSILAQGSNYTDVMDYDFDDTDIDGDGRLTLPEEWSYMLKLDVDGDGRISMQEFAAITQLYSSAIQNATMTLFRRYDNNSDGFFEREDVAAYFNDIDSNGDGSVSKNTFVTFIDVMYANLGTSLRTEAINADRAQASIRIAFAIADTNNDNMLSVDEEFLELLDVDRNNDSRVSKDEYLARFAMLPPKVQAAGEKIFSMFDADKNGFLERSDVAAGMKLLDTDVNGFVDVNEYTSQIIKVYAGLGVSLGELIPLASNNDPIRAAFNQADINRDGNISANEQWTALAVALDTNGDQKLSRDEYMTRYNVLPAQYRVVGTTIFNMFDINKDGFIDKTDITKGFPKVDTDGNGLISFSEFSLFVNELYSNLGLTFGGQTGGSATVNTDFGFTEADVNKDGILTLAEEWAVLLKKDLNGDGKISEDEYVSSYGNSTDARKIGLAVFHLTDTDNSSFVEANEFAEDFKVLDINKDGSVTRAEYVAYVSQMFKTLGANVGQSIVSSDFGFSQIDANKDGLISFDEEWAAIVVLDKDGDNRVSQAEYVASVTDGLGDAAPKIFARFDSDSNGYFEKDDIRKFITLVDTNGDGSMSSGEYSSFVKGMLIGFGVDISQLS